MKIKITAILRVSERLHFEVIERLMSPKKFWDFREMGPSSVQTNSSWGCNAFKPGFFSGLPHFCAMISQSLVSSKQGSFLFLVLVYASTKLIVPYWNYSEIQSFTTNNCLEQQRWGPKHTSQQPNYSKVWMKNSGESSYC